MIHRLKLKNFKNFSDIDLQLGRLTTLIGTNASGKSNIRDAFRFLHGISRGYNLAEIIGEKWGEGGVLQWQGIRGGTREVVLHGENTFTIEAESSYSLTGVEGKIRSHKFIYAIEINPGDSGRAPYVVHESLKLGKTDVFFDMKTKTKNHLKVQLIRGNRPGKYPPRREFINTAPVLFQIYNEVETKPKAARTFARWMIRTISSFRFLDLSPSAMRIPSLPGAITLGDRGENLSSVLQYICKDEDKKTILLEWIKELTPMDAIDFVFPSDQTGRVLLTLVEMDGRKTSAYSASDGTLRFLAMIAALLGPENATFYFFEEMENGIHPNRLHLLLNLIEKNIKTNNVQIVATSHSPTMLSFLGADALNSASLVYRLPDRNYSQIKKILDIPEAHALIEKQDLGKLIASGWLEDAVFLTEDALEGKN